MEYVTDTHPLIWHLDHDPRLSRPAADIYLRADRGAVRIWVPSIVLIEIRYLVEKGRIDRLMGERTMAILHETDATSSYTVAPLDWSVAKAMEGVPRDAIPDMPDRIIVATACHLGIPLISKDQRIQSANLLRIIW